MPHYLDPDVEPLWFDMPTYKRLCDFYKGYLVFPLLPLHQLCENIDTRPEKYYYTAKCTYVVCAVEEEHQWVIPKLLFDEYLTDEKPEQRAYNQFKFAQIRKMGLPYTNLDETDILPPI